MSPGRIAAIMFLLSIVTASAQTTPLTCGQPNTQGTIACFSPATNLQSTDIIYGMQATGPQRSPQTVRITPAQIVAAGGGGGGGGSTLTFGTHLTGTSYNGSSPVTIGTDAASTNAAGTIVARDGSGNFSAGTITSSLTGHASLDLPLTGGTLTGKLNTLLSGTGGAGFNLPPGAAPTSPVNGDVWMTSAGLFGQVAGSTVGPFGTGGGGGGNVSNSGTPASGQIASWVSTTTIQGNTTGTGILTALGVNVGSAGAPVINGGALGTPSSGNGSNLTNIPLGTAVTGILLGANGGTGVANTGKTLTLGGSLTTTGAATPTLAFGASTFTYTFPGATANLDYQVGSFVNGHCLQASGTAGGIAILALHVGPAAPSPSPPSRRTSWWRPPRSPARAQYPAPSRSTHRPGRPMRS